MIRVAWLNKRDDHIFIVIQIRLIEIVEGQLFQFHEDAEKHKDGT